MAYNVHLFQELDLADDLALKILRLKAAGAYTTCTQVFHTLKYQKNSAAVYSNVFKIE